jgi:hypothetical protein
VNPTSAEEAVVSKVDSDPVNHPSHYNHGGIEVIEFLEAYFPTDPLLWQVGKYISRAGHKDPTKTVEDLEKAEFLLKRRIEKERSRQA